MDDTTRLVSELLNKLAELDQRVCDYRQGMAQEFQRYSHQLLHNVPEHVSARVEDVLAGELLNYPALGPGLTLDPASPFSDLRRSARRGRASPPPVLPHTSGVPPNDSTSGSPNEREREREFHGLFVPSYLPLLDVMTPNKTISTSTAALAPTTPQDKESDITPEPLPHVQIDTTAKRPDPVRRLTEETVSSITSEDSVSRTRRSALRRSSSGSTKGAQSPRRVRFDVEGVEVLTTVSPPTSPRNYDLLTSPLLEGQVTPMRESINHTVFEEETNKISSTERLKALARISTEDTSKWTVVGDLQDDDEEEEGLVMSSSKRNSKALIPKPVAGTVLNIAGAHTQDKCQSIGGDDLTDDILDLTPLCSFKDKKSSKENSTMHQVIPKAIEPPATVLYPPPHKAQGLEEEDMFEFEDAESALQLKEEFEEQITPLAGNSAEGPSVTLYSTPPPTSPASSVFKETGATVGSYKGKPFIIGVVNEELHKKAVEMGDFCSFVGSVDGRSGVDASNSYRQDPNFFNGTPRSLGERLMEEAHARRSAGKAHKENRYSSTGDVSRHNKAIMLPACA
ncbi:hypothetical protein HD806DRAFT_517642 [Xylariaceae sp. AK1471]|nr:hypothetical protein HD806DRAFT_517642 [Xylariaceae sp. AK1471]